MTSSTHDLSLQGLPNDVRLELFSQMILPPFDGCQVYGGLWLSCRQLYEEAQLEGTRQLRIYTQNVSSSLKNITCEGTSEAKLNESCPTMEVQVPESMYSRPVIEVKIPFFLPPKTHEWHLQKPPARMCGNGQRQILGTPGPRRDRYLAERNQRREWQQQKELYSKRVETVLECIGELQNLYAKIDIQLVANEDVAKIIKEDKSLNRQLDNSFLLSTVVLGKLLETYLIQIRRQSYSQLQRWPEAWAFHATTVDTSWDFTSKDPAKRLQEQPYRGYTAATHSQARAEYTADRREGFVQMDFDVKSYLQAELRCVKDRIGTAKSCISGQEACDEVELDRKRQALARDMQRLRELESSKP